MKDSAKEIASLIYEYLRKGLSSSEKKRLWEWVNKSEVNQKYFESITSRAELESIIDQFEYPDKEAIWQKVVPEPDEVAIVPLPYITPPPFRFKWWKYTAAAMIILLAGSGWFLFNRAAKAADATAGSRNDVLPPMGNRTILTLADGRMLMLDSIGTGALALQGGTSITKQANDQLVFQLKPPGTTSIPWNKILHKNNPGTQYSETTHLRRLKTSSSPYNTITTASGATYRLQLPDGSLVWINAASSLRFPTNFTGSERRVELTGEAYFEIKPQLIAGNKKKIPFKVGIRSASGADLGEIEVLGTKFNVNAYEDEQLIKTTLTEGSVKIKKGNARSLLQPGQQGLFKATSSRNSTDPIKIQPTPNEEEVLAWKNGLFVFDNTSLETIMRHVARWYDVSVEYEEKVNRNLHGSIPRNVPLSSVLRILELADGVHFKIEGKTITVTR